MNINFVDLKKNYKSIETEIKEQFNSLFERCDFINGEKVTTFESNFAKFLNIKHFIGCANGTDALEIAVKCLQLSNDDEIIVQGNTYIATCLGALNNNIKMVLCDVDKETHMIDLDLLKTKITKKTKAIIIVHLYGAMPNMDTVMKICNENNLYLIEDCAQAHGALWNGKYAGSFGHLSCFSFYPGKNLGAYGDGGGIGTNCDEYNELIRKIINIGCKKKYYHEIIGRNSRLDTMQASFLDVKLKHLDKWNAIRRSDAKIYEKYLHEIGDIKFQKIEEGCTPVYHLFVIRTKYRDQLKEYLHDKKIECLIHYPISIAENEAIKKYDYNLSDVKICIENSNEILSLPMYPELELHEITYICDQIKNFFFENNVINLNHIKIADKPGVLHCINNFVFPAKRLFYVNFEEDFDKNNPKRGFHANMNFNEFIIIIEGSIKIKLIDVDLIETINIVNKNETFYIPKMKWIEYEVLSKDTVILCLADKTMNESCSVKIFEKFLHFNGNSSNR
jgi:dTDP-4-amino-4,6-dideoxygalactose transaminase